MRVFHLIFRSRISALATFSLVVLACVAVWKIHSFIYSDVTPTYAIADSTASEASNMDADMEQEMLLLGLSSSSNPSAIASSDPIAMIGPLVVAQMVGQYAGLLDSGGYTSARGTAAAEQVAEHIRAAISYKTYSISDFKTDSDTSYARMLTYRSDMRVAFEPLLENADSELEVYGKFVETSDPAHLAKLRTVAGRYREAARNGAALTIPRDAVNYHKDILNALEQFAATLEKMSEYPDDAFASIALLRSYNDAEQKVFYAFNSLGNYYGQKTL